MCTCFQLLYAVWRRCFTPRGHSGGPNARPNHSSLPPGPFLRGLLYLCVTAGKDLCAGEGQVRGRKQEEGERRARGDIEP